MNAPEAQQAFFKDLVAELLHRHRAEFFRDLHEAGISPTDVELARLQSGNRSWGTDLAPQRPSQQAPKPRRRRPMLVAADSSRIPRSCGVRRNRI